MLNKFIVLIVIIFFASCNSKNEVIQTILNRNTVKQYYHVGTKKKMLFKTDTVQEKFTVFLQKNSKDSLYGFDFKVESKQRIIYHINDSTYYFNKQEKSFFILNKYKSSFNKLLLANNMFSEKDVKDSVHVSIHYEDEIVTLKKKTDNTKGLKNIYSEYEILIQKQQISKITNNLDFQSSNQYEEFYFYDYNDTKNINLENDLKKAKQEYPTLSDINAIVNKKPTKIIKFKKISKLQGIYFKNRKPFVLNKVTSKIIILDYWYMSCYPCIKSFPFLHELDKKYPDIELEIIGINNKDVLENNEKILEEFCIKNNMTYPIIFTKENPFNINRYPTIIVLNEKREIVFSYFGYNIEKEKELKILIDKMLTK